MNLHEVKIYRSTWMMRILVSITLLPLGILFTNADTLYFTIICLTLFFYTWIAGFRIKITLLPDKIIRQGVFSKKIIPLNENLLFYYGAIQNTYYGIKIGLHHHIVLKNGQHKIIANSNIKHIEHLRDRLIETELAYLPAKLERTAKNPRQLLFGPIKLSSTSLMYQNKLATFREIYAVEIENGHVLIKKMGSPDVFISIEVSSIPNLASFLAILSFYRQTAQKAATI